MINKINSNPEFDGIVSESRAKPTAHREKIVSKVAEKALQTAATAGKKLSIIPLALLGEVYALTAPMVAGLRLFSALLLTIGWGISGFAVWGINEFHSVLFALEKSCKRLESMLTVSSLEAKKTDLEKQLAILEQEIKTQAQTIFGPDARITYGIGASSENMESESSEQESVLNTESIEVSLGKENDVSMTIDEMLKLRENTFKKNLSTIQLYAGVKKQSVHRAFEKYKDAPGKGTTVEEICAKDTTILSEVNKLEETVGKFVQEMDEGLESFKLAVRLSSAENNTEMLVGKMEEANDLRKRIYEAKLQVIDTELDRYLKSKQRMIDLEVGKDWYLRPVDILGEEIDQQFLDAVQSFRESMQNVIDLKKVLTDMVKNRGEKNREKIHHGISHKGVLKDKTSAFQKTCIIAARVIGRFDWAANIESNVPLSAPTDVRKKGIIGRLTGSDVRVFPE